MAQNDGRREVVNDPLAVTGREVRPDRSLALSGVRSPSNGGPSGAGQGAAEMSAAFGSLQQSYAGYVDSKKDDWIAEGKMAYMAGKTEADLLENGNRFTHQGFLQLQTRDSVNKWYMDEAAGIDEARNRMDPAEYQEYIKGRRSELLDGIQDPYAKQVAVAAFEQFSPQLVQSQFAKNNEFERGQRINAFNEASGSIAQTSPTRSVRVDPSVPLALSPTPVGPVMAVSARDRDIGIRTMLGEAANEGDVGQAAVAHVLRNRAVDGRWPGSIAGVSLQSQQFSAWNKGAGGNHLVTKYGPGSGPYEKAAKVFDAVMSGRHVDPTNGATHYYSPGGMTALVRAGSQSNTVPRWLASTAAESNGTVTVGGHIFAGRANMPAAARAAVAPPPAPAAAGSNPYAAAGVSDEQFARMQQGAPAPALAMPGDEAASGPAGEILAPLNEVAAEEGVAVTGVDEPGANNELQDFWRNYKGLNPNDKATAVSKAMENTLRNGDDTTFRDGGGIGMLRELGATPDEIARVEAAAAAYATSQLDNFDAGAEAWRADVLDRASTGTSLDSLLSEIDARVKENGLSDSQAQSLARSAAERVRSVEGIDAAAGNVPYMTELGGVYQRIASGDLDFGEAAAEAQSLGDKYGLDTKEVNRVLGQMFSMDQSAQNSMRNDAAAAAKKYAENEGRKQEVATAISRGVGLNLLDGNIDTVNAAGQKATVSAKEYGVQTIRDKHMNAWKSKVEAGTVGKPEAIAGAIRDTFLELQRQQIVDPETQAQIVGALTGPITEPDGSLGTDALEAYDTWLILKNTPEIKPGYLAQVVGNEDVRGLLETAYVLEGGNITGGRALRRAHELLGDPLTDPDRRIAKDAIWIGKLDKGIDGIIADKAGPGFWDSLPGFNSPAQLGADRNNDRAMRGRDRAEAFVRARAEAYHLNSPQQDAEVSLKLALADLGNSASVVAGNLILHPDSKLTEDMGLSQFGADEPDKAVTEYLREYGADIWGADYTDRVPTPNGFTARDAPVLITYNHRSKMLSVQLYKNEATGEMLGVPRFIPAAAIGSEYQKQQRELNGWDNMWNSIFAGPRAMERRTNQMQGISPDVMDAIQPTK